MADHFGPYAYGQEIRFATAPTYWAGFEHPGNIALGDGTPLFTGLGEAARLTLADTRPFKSGKVLLTYKPFTAEQSSRDTHAAAGARG